ncbi:MAG: peptide ABC transporter substrate-binding protein [Chloroflexi bacterium]|nr:peptide ABC transporter substrate-binding protein [Chloroflexota bacterium]
MGTRYWYKAFAVAAISGLVLAACAQGGPAATTAPTAAATATAAPTVASARGTGGDLKILYWQAPTILNPHQATGTKDNDASRLMIEPIAAWGPDGKPFPVLAAEVPTVENGGVTKDLKTVTWKLKSGVKWSDGSAFSADDAAFTYTYQCDPKSATSTDGGCADVASVTAPNATTLVVTYKNPQPFFWLWGVGTSYGVLQKTQFSGCVGEKAKDCPANLKPIGTGPYKLREFKPGDVVLYDLNENYRDPNKPFFKSVTFKGGGDAPSAARAVCQTGDIDFGWNLQVEAAVLRPMVEAADSKCAVSPQFGVLERIHINFADPSASLGAKRSEPDTKHPFFSDINVRKAVAMAANRTAVAEQLYGKYGGVPVCNVVVIPESFVSKNTASLDTCKYDLVAAEKLLQDNGWVKGADGVRAKGGVRLEITYQTSTNAVRQKTQDIIKADLEKIGFKVTLKNAPASTFFTNTSPDGANKFFADLEEFASGQEPDPYGTLLGYTCDERAGSANNWNKGNYSRYCNPEYDKQFQIVRTETDPAKRQAAAVAANDILIKDAVVIPLVNRVAPTADGASKLLKGHQTSAFDSSLWDIANWSK